jgi:crotonobetainyl-CoA:carnitine CoA-transferase CaiB-like acyl-CoA transferase
MSIRAADGSLQYAPPFRLSDHRFEVQRWAPRQGEHSVEVLREAGLADDEIEGLVAAGAARIAPAP